MPASPSSTQTRGAPPYVEGREKKRPHETRTDARRQLNHHHSEPRAVHWETQLAEFERSATSEGSEACRILEDAVAALFAQIARSFPERSVRAQVLSHDADAADRLMAACIRHGFTVPHPWISLHMSPRSELIIEPLLKVIPRRAACRAISHGLTEPALSASLAVRDAECTIPRGGFARRNMSRAVLRAHH